MPGFDDATFPNSIRRMTQDSTFRDLLLWTSSYIAVGGVDFVRRVIHVRNSDVHTTKSKRNRAISGNDLLSTGKCRFVLNRCCTVPLSGFFA